MAAKEFEKTLRRQTQYADRAASALCESGFVLWHMARPFCNAKLGRYRGDIEQASPFN
jgi:hypothetical protein